MARIYVETTIPSFYFEIRTEPEMVSRRNWTRQWWDNAVRTGDELLTGIPVIAELERGAFQSREDALGLLTNLNVLDIDPEVLEIVEAYINRRLMPADPTSDALHLALASYHRCDFLVT